METTKITYINWINAKVAKPSKDGYYLCMTTPGFITVLHYVAKHQLFNVREDYTDNALNVTWWTTVPELPYEEDENEA